MVAGRDPQLGEPAGDLADRGAELRVGDRIASRRRERGPRAEALGGVERDPRDRRVLCGGGGHGWTPGGGWRAAMLRDARGRVIGCPAQAWFGLSARSGRETASMPVVRRLPDGSEPPPAPLVLADGHRIGTVAAELVLNRLWARPGTRMLLPTGRSPETMYAVLRAHARAGHLPAGHRHGPAARRVCGPGPRRPAQLRGAAARAARGHPARRDPHHRRRRARPGVRGGPARRRPRGGADRPRRARAGARRARRVRRAARADGLRRGGGVARRDDPGGRRAGVRRRRARAGQGAHHRARNAVPGARADPAGERRRQGAGAARDARGSGRRALAGLAAAGPSSPDDHLRPGRGVPAEAAARVLERPRDRRARPPGSRRQRRAPDLRRVARAAASRAAAGAPQPRPGGGAHGLHVDRRACRRPSR